ncbi:hypothetical protein B0T19DRAFT_405957 [Cercophora scortea]|uniref:Uncharacterized protein n=1 Tax=Cercophora scortea TaxID=314031 RepID=A0AAE0J1N6_9PEZI|nr:hypothetical protein B0T19DRAFT_405957 [Cercophora scortea]
MTSLSIPPVLERGARARVYRCSSIWNYLLSHIPAATVTVFLSLFPLSFPIPIRGATSCLATAIFSLFLRRLANMSYYVCRRQKRLEIRFNVRFPSMRGTAAETVDEIVVGNMNEQKP